MLNKTLSSLLLLLFLVGCVSKQQKQNRNESFDADKIFTNGKFYTVDTNQPWVEAVAIKDGKYLYVGNTEKALSYRGNN
ncbi:MAG: amidohydrolase, partial [Gammaproteobacteria bacterium]|nr:amidohydrolase [Gammaproteobacteria bacterium]